MPTQERGGRANPPQALYPKLRPKRNGPGREQVALDQRTRLHAATVEALAMYGYAGTTVAKLIALAGVSRLTFYEHFSSKEACVLASYEEIVARATERIMTAYNGEQEGPARVIAAYTAFVAELVERPKAAKLVIVDVLALGPAALDRVEQARLTFNRMTNESAGGVLDGVTPPETVVRGIVGGIWQVARRRLLTDRLQELPDLGGEMLMWAISYRAPASEVERLSLGTPCKNGALSPTTPRIHLHSDAETQREPEDEHKRILHAAAELAARDGYSNLNTARIVQESGVSDESFFERFENSEECFLAALQLLCVEALATALRGARAGETWPDGVQLGIRALLDHIASDRTLARVAFVEVFGTGAAGLSLREELLGKIADMCVDDVPDGHSLSRVAAEAIVGAVWTMAYDRIVHDRAHELPALAGYASYMVLAPVIGADAAIQSILAGPLAAT